MDKAYEAYEARQLVLELEMLPAVPPKSNRLSVWEYDKEMYKKHNGVERLFRHLKGFRRIFSRFDKLDSIFMEEVVSTTWPPADASGGGLI